MVGHQAIQHRPNLSFPKPPLNALLSIRRCLRSLSPVDYVVKAVMAYSTPLSNYLHGKIALCI